MLPIGSGDLVINDQLNDPIEDCQNRESSKQASYKRLGDKNSVLDRREKATPSSDPKTTSTK